MGISTIQWTDYTFNPWIGCRKVAPECANCYAETLDRNRYSKTLAPGTKENPVSHWGSGPRHRTKTWGDPVKWNKHAKNNLEAFWEWANEQPDDEVLTPPHRPRVFCASLADWLDDENVPIEWFADLLRLIHDTPHLDWLLLTKRPKNWEARLEKVRQWAAFNTGRGGDDENEGWTYPTYDFVLAWLAGIAPDNVWIGVSAGADQQAALDIPARVHFLSCEPMLRPLDTTHAARFKWIIFGGESGSKARALDMQWIRDGVAFCLAHGVSPFVKQLGAVPYQAVTNGASSLNMPAFLKDKHGGDMDEWPEDLRVREFPTPKPTR